MIKAARSEDAARLVALREATAVGAALERGAYKEFSDAQPPAAHLSEITDPVVADS